MPELSIRPVADEDRDTVIGIFNHYITTSFAAYPDKPVPPAFLSVLSEGVHAFDVIEHEGEIVGFGILRPFLPFSTFARSATVTTFIDPAHRHQGFGTMIMDGMIREARRKGITMLLANISSKNQESLIFHKKQGFFECGRMYEVGEKFNELFDIVWMQKDLAPGPATWKLETVSLPG
jgi:L-amino acid N-acyltransferase YncA